MPHINPLAEQAVTDPEDLALVAHVQAGSRQALETLLERHQPWIYNILVRMLYGDIAVLTFNLLSHRAQADGTDAIVARWNATAVYRAMEGTWKSIHVHWSYIKPDLKAPVSEEAS